MISASGRRLRQSEVEHLHAAICSNLDIRGLEISVDDSLLVRGSKRFGNLSGNTKSLVDRFPVRP